MSNFSKKYLYFVPLFAAMTVIGCSTSNAEQSTLFMQDVEPTGFAGSYLASHHAQSTYDWSSASRFLNDVIKLDPDNEELIRRAMILSIGTGNLDLAAKRAQTLIDAGDSNELASIILTLKNIKDKDFDDAASVLAAMPEGDMSAFIKPLLSIWVHAGQGEQLQTETLKATSLHLYHAAMAALYLDDKKTAEALAEDIMASGTLSNHDALRVADILALTGRSKDAITLYEGILAQDPENKVLNEKAEAAKKDLQSGGVAAITPLIPDAHIKTAVEGAAIAMYDMAYILHREYSDSSTKLFAHMALALDENMTNARLLLADTLTRNGRYDEAINQLSDIPPDHASYIPAQRHAAELMAESGDLDGALSRLNTLFTDKNDIESLIRIGDLYRQQENFESALTAYNQAAQKIGNEKIPAEYWHLLYARGMAYEREGKWSNAEADLKAALVYQPNHPYLLNYLGYGWADQGTNLQESLELIKRAVSLRPYDGYIIDSLGWVQYRMGLYEDALPNLEKAVSLLPYDTTINDHLGDVYWQLGRHTEARFQWERAMNYREDGEDIALIEQKLKYGLEGITDTKQAHK